MTRFLEIVCGRCCVGRGLRVAFRACPVSAEPELDLCPNPGDQVELGPLQGYLNLLLVVHKGVWFGLPLF